MVDKYGMTKFDRKFFKRTIIIGIICIVLVALAFLSRQLWCQHDFEKVGEDEATCETAGVEYRKCRKCGLKREKKIKPLGHNMKSDGTDYEIILDALFGKTTYVCSRCDYSETGEEKCYGDFKGYCAKIGLALWLMSNKSAVLDVDTAVATLIDDDYYHILGTYKVEAADHAEQVILAEVEIGSEDNGEAYPVGIGDKIVYAHVFKATTSAGIASEDRIYPKEG